MSHYHYPLQEDTVREDRRWMEDAAKSSLNLLMTAGLEQALSEEDDRRRFCGVVRYYFRVSLCISL